LLLTPNFSWIKASNIILSMITSILFIYNIICYFHSL
jgi:hypothetical protein